LVIKKGEQDFVFSSVFVRARPDQLVGFMFNFGIEGAVSGRDVPICRVVGHLQMPMIPWPRKRTRNRSARPPAIIGSHANRWTNKRVTRTAVASSPCRRDGAPETSAVASSKL